MYEPPNRGGKTLSALNRGAGGNDPGSRDRSRRLANTFLHAARLHDGVERLGLLRPATHGDQTSTPRSSCRSRKNPDGSTITGPAYEYIVTAAAHSRTRSTIPRRRWTKRRRR